jgi:hypothetical protein
MRLLLMWAFLQLGCVVHRSLTREQVLARLSEKFPIEKRKSLFYVRLQNPDISFPGGNLLGVRLEFELGAPMYTPHKGHAAVEGQVDFRDNAIYLRDAVVRSLDLGVPESHMRPILETAILAALVEQPIYRIDDARVKKVWVEDQLLKLEIRP